MSAKMPTNNGKISRKGDQETMSGVEAAAFRKANRAALERAGLENSQKDYGNSYHLITSINIDVPLHKELFRNIKTYARWIRDTTKVPCHIHVIPTYYRTGDPALDNCVAVSDTYVRDGRLLLNGAFEVICDADVSITNVNPTSGFQIVGSTPTAIIPHPRVSDRMTMSPRRDRQRHLLTTLTVGRPKYRRGGVGTKAVRHHTFGFTIVEPTVEGKWFAARNVTAKDNGSFTDIHAIVSGGKVREAGRFPGIVFGDLHGVEMDVDSMLALKPYWDRARAIVVHDVYSFSNVLNHHEKTKPLYRRTQLSITQEIADTNDILLRAFGSRKLTSADSNHDDSLSRWLDYGNMREIPTVEDQRLWHELHLFRIDNPDFNLMTHLLGYDVLDFEINEGELKGWHVASHGHKWGSTLAQYKGGTGKTITGHTHKAERHGGQISVGNWIDGRPGYAKGSAFTWSRGDALIHKDGSAQLLRVVHYPAYSGLHKGDKG